MGPEEWETLANIWKSMAAGYNSSWRGTSPTANVAYFPSMQGPVDDVTVSTVLGSIDSGAELYNDVMCESYVPEEELTAKDRVQVWREISQSPELKYCYRRLQNKGVSFEEAVSEIKRMLERAERNT